jgi:hypothetical protein
MGRCGSHPLKNQKRNCKSIPAAISLAPFANIFLPLLPIPPGGDFDQTVAIEFGDRSTKASRKGFLRFFEDLCQPRQFRMRKRKDCLSLTQASDPYYRLPHHRSHLGAVPQTGPAEPNAQTFQLIHLVGITCRLEISGKKRSAQLTYGPFGSYLSDFS